MKRLLVICPHFPPSNTPDMQRVRMSLPYYKRLGWEPVVLSVDPAFVEFPKDEWLLRSIPDDIRIVRVKAWPVKFTRRLGFSSLAIRSFFSIFKSGNRLLKKEKFDLILFSTTAFHICALGPYWKKRFRIPFIIDLQDPWRNDYYLNKPKGERPPKFFLSYRVDKYLEGRTLPVADGIITVSQGYVDELLSRYRRLTADRFVVIPFAASMNDFDLLEKYSVQNNVIAFPAGKFNIVYVGRGGYDLSFSLRIIFGAFLRLLAKNPARYADFHFTFIGTSYAPAGKGEKTILPVAVEFGLEKYVTEITDRIGFFDSLSVLKKADMLLVPGSTDTSYTASKIYPYLLAGRPLIAVFNENSSVITALKEAGCGEFVAFSNSSMSEQYEEECALKISSLADGTSGRLPTDPARLFAYTAENNTRRQVDFFNSVLSYG